MECQTQRLQDQVAELQERLAAAQRAFREAYDGGTKAIEQRNRYKAMLQQIADDNPPLSAFRAKYGDIEAFENSDNTGDVAMAAMYRMAASIGDKARAALRDQSPEAICSEPSQRDAAIEQLKDAVTELQEENARLREVNTLLRNKHTEVVMTNDDLRELLVDASQYSLPDKLATRIREAVHPDQHKVEDQQRAALGDSR